MFVLDSNLKGAVAEVELAAAAVRLGVPVFTPLAEHGRSDLVLEVAGRLWRVQCKWASVSADGDILVVRTGTRRLSTRGYLTTTYDASQIDYFGVYCGDLDRCYLVPVAVAAGQHQLHLRLTPPGNGQRACITLAEKFSFDGAIAQLGERLHGMQEVAGSSPASSTPSPEPVTVGVNAFRDGLGSWMDRVAAGEEVLLTRHGRPKIRLLPAAAP
jgi:prevent-host-death family protein